MSNWISVNDQLPKPFEVVWIYWRDHEVLLGCKTEESDMSEPSECWYSFDYEKCRWAYSWMPLERSLDKPYAPEEE